MADFIFDGPNKLIIEPTGAGNTVALVLRDIYSAWKRWVQSGQGVNFEQAFSIEGGTPIGTTGLFTGYTVVMLNQWRIQPADYDHQLTIDGNLFSGDGIISVSPPTANTNVFVLSAVSAQGISTTAATLSPAQETALFTARDHARAAAAQTQPT